MPGKTLLESARRYRMIRNAAEFGLSTTQHGFDASKIIGRKRRLIAEFSNFRAGNSRADASIF